MKLIVYFLLLALPAFGQSKIEADRPGETQTTSVVPNKKFQAEFSVRKEEHDEDTAFFIRIEDICTNAILRR